eukprot:ANDGO_04830.mRNA.1 hypothetical protein
MWGATWIALHPFLSGTVALTTGIGAGALLEKAMPPVGPANIILSKVTSRNEARFSILSLLETAAMGAATRSFVLVLSKWVGLIQDAPATASSAAALSRWEPYLLAPMIAALSGDTNSLWIAAGTLFGTGLLHIAYACAPSLVVGIEESSLLRIPPQYELPFALLMYAAMFALKKAMTPAAESVFNIRKIEWTPAMCGLAMGALHFVSMLTSGHPISIVQPILRLLSPTTPSARSFVWSHPYSALLLAGIATGSFLGSWCSGSFRVRKSSSKKRLGIKERIALASIGLAIFLVVRFFP